MMVALRCVALRYVAETKTRCPGGLLPCFGFGAQDCSSLAVTTGKQAGNLERARYGLTDVGHGLSQDQRLLLANLIRPLTRAGAATVST